MGVKLKVYLGICVEWFFLMVIGILGIFKVGVVYVFLDFSYFLECLVYMIFDV